MRIIKLSPNDVDMRTRDDVETYFHGKLRGGGGAFYMTPGRIADTGLEPGEILVFSYEGEIVYTAIAASGRLDNEGDDAHMWPNYFRVDLASLTPVSGQLLVLEAQLRHLGLCTKHLVRTQGWPRLDESGERRRQLEEVVSRVCTRRA
jgi:hypothetical protein